MRLLIVKDPRAAEQSLLCFSRMMRYVLDTQRGANDRVRLGDELDLVHDYLALEMVGRRSRQPKMPRPDACDEVVDSDLGRAVYDHVCMGSPL